MAEIPLVYDRRKYDHLTLEDKVDVALQMLDSIVYAFPEGPYRHREDHIEITVAHARTETLKANLVEKSLWAMIAIAAALVVTGAIAKLSSLGG